MIENKIAQALLTDKFNSDDTIKVTTKNDAIALK